LGGRRGDFQLKVKSEIDVFFTMIIAFNNISTLYNLCIGKTFGKVGENQKKVRFLTKSAIFAHKCEIVRFWPNSA